MVNGYHGGIYQMVPRWYQIDERAEHLELPLRVRQRVWETEDPPTLFLAETHSLVIELTEQCHVRFERAAERSASEVPRILTVSCPSTSSSISIVAEAPPARPTS